MNMILLFFSCVVLCHATSIEVEEIDDTARTLIVKEGYHVRRYKVETEDGYILDLYRMSHYRQNFTKDYIDHYTGKEADNEDTVFKQSVLLMPTMMSGFEEFVIVGYSEGLAFALVDVGYDVFLGNVRGSAHGRKHTKLNADSDKEFWNFSLQEIGEKDLPAIVDKIIAMNGEDTKINYVGHMEGSTIFQIMTSEKPEYNEKFNKMLALGPIAFDIMTGTTNEMILEIYVAISKFYDTHDAGNAFDSEETIRNALGDTYFKPSNDILHHMEDKCKNGYSEVVCNSLYFLMNGYNSHHYNETTVKRAASYIQSSMSAKQVLHYVQMCINGKLHKYVEHFHPQHHGEEPYDLTKVTTPTIILYTPEDSWGQKQAVQKLIEKLPNVTYSHKFETLTNSMDLLYTKDAREVVYSTVIQMLKQVIQRA